jgi:hypothetical protein
MPKVGRYGVHWAGQDHTPEFDALVTDYVLRRRARVPGYSRVDLVREAITEKLERESNG